MATYQLNVIFHGPFLFVIYSDRIEVLSPDINEHDFGAGTWQEETPCDPGTYILKGITEQKIPLPPPSAQTYAILNAKALPNMKIPKDAYYRFVMQPLPSSMIALGLLTPVSPALFTGNDVKNISVPNQIATAHLFSYIMDPGDKPQLENFSWQPPEAKIIGDLHATNLHVFSESPFDLGDLHSHADFDLMVHMLPGLSLALVRPFPDIDPKDFVNPNVKNLGIDDEEQGGLRGLPKERHHELVPPRICDSPSLVITNA